MTTLPLAELPGEADRESEKDRKDETARRVAAAVCRNVMASLGRPRDFYRVAALQLWGNHYRVNVLTGPDAVSARIANSFFVSADDRGNVIESTPKITRKYGPPSPGGN